ncbi:MAG: pentapeptide repeat-containing protein [Clostridia bacterium]|nr:pentapeptide repeat-containing protein [Clostridia bacterium]
MFNYNNADKKNKSFMYQNLQKSKSYNSDFSNSNFDYVCLRGAHLKSCTFDGCTFRGAEFTGTNLKDSSFKNAIFENTVFEGAKLEGVDFRDAQFKNSFFVSSQMGNIKCLDVDQPGIRIFSEMPEIQMGEPLRAAIEKLMQNDFVKKSRVMDTKDKTMNTVSVMILMEKFGEERLVESLGKVEAYLDRDFYTLSYIIKIIEKI